MYVICGFQSGYADKHRAREKRRGTSMAIRLNQEAVGHAQNLIKGAAIREEQRLEQRETGFREAAVKQKGTVRR